MSADRNPKADSSGRSNSGASGSGTNLSTYSRYRPHSSAEHSTFKPSYGEKSSYYGRGSSGSRYQPSKSGGHGYSRGGRYPTGERWSNEFPSGSYSGYRNYYSPKVSQPYRGGGGKFSGYSYSSRSSQPNGGYSRSYKPSTGRSNSASSNCSIYDERRDKSEKEGDKLRTDDSESMNYRHPLELKKNSLPGTASGELERSASPLDTTQSNTIQLQRTQSTKPSLIPSNFKDYNDNDDDDDDDDNYDDDALNELNENLRKNGNTSNLTQDNENSSIDAQESKSTYEQKLDGQNSLITKPSPTAFEPKSLVDSNSAISTEGSSEPAVDIDQHREEQEDSDDYKVELEPEEEDTTPSLPNHENGFMEREQGEEEGEEESKVIVPLQKINENIFPMKRVDFRVWELKNHKRSDIIRRLPHLLKDPIKNFTSYPFYQRNFLVHEQGIKVRLLDNISAIKTSLFDQKVSLLNEYSNRTEEWKVRSTNMENQLKELNFRPQEQQKVDESPQEELQFTQSVQSRRGRYHGDTVRSEAEFLEILQNLEKEKEQDPLYRAEQVAAKIPDMILDPIQKELRLINTNNLVLNKKKWAKRITTDPVDTFTKHEHELFCEAFMSFPKRFGRISATMGGLRTAEECVLHYYKTKKSLTDYKQLIALKKKRNSKARSGRRSTKSKTSTTANTPNAGTPLETPATEKEFSLDDLKPKEAIEEEVYTETGRRKRAAAPVFDSLDKNKTQKETFEGKLENNESVENERKRSFDDLASKESLDDQKKQILRKKAKSGRPKKVETHDFEVIIDESSTKRSITSYWSIKDINNFAVLLHEYGTQWNIISQKLMTKSVTMVRNYFQKNADSHGWREVAEKANQRLNLMATNSQPTELSNPKNPPLGFFTLHENIPSNILPDIVNHDEPKSLLPPMKNFSPFSSVSLEPSVREPSNSLQPIDLNAPHPVLPASTLLSPSSETETPIQPQLQPQPQPQTQISGQHQVVQTTSSVTNTHLHASSRPNPFSISNLLNPTESSPTHKSNGNTASDPVFQEKQEVNLTTFNGVSDKLPNGADSAPLFNPLDALVAAAENNSSAPPAAQNLYVAKAYGSDQNLVHQRNGSFNSKLLNATPPSPNRDKPFPNTVSDNLTKSEDCP